MNRYRLKVFFTCFAWGLALLLALFTGPQGIFLLSHDLSPDLMDTIVWDIRLPRILVACLSGGALAVAGVVSQGVFRNPLAGPSIIGTVSGANLFVVLFMFLGLALDHWLIQPMAAFLGALASTLLILILSKRESFKSPGSLLLLGFSINAICAAATTSTRIGSVPGLM